MMSGEPSCWLKEPSGRTEEAGDDVGRTELLLEYLLVAKNLNVKYNI